MARTYVLTEAEAQMAFTQVSAHCEALKNWIATAVEGGRTDYAKELVTELRQYQSLYAKLNTKVHDHIAQLAAEHRARENRSRIDWEERGGEPVSNYA